jgi:Vacuolar sorting 38 and autophagy-related subunit 14
MRPASSKLSLCCPSCARSVLYETRLRNAKILVEREQLAVDIESLTSSGDRAEGQIDSGNTKQDVLASRRWSMESLNVKRIQARERIKDVQEHNQTLRHDIKAAREEMAKQKAILRKKRAENDTVRSVVLERRRDKLDKLREEIKKTVQSWNAVGNKAVETRSFLCGEAAHLSALKQRKKMRGGVVRDHYTIGGVPVISIRDINSSNANELTTSLTNTAHLLALVSFYLSIRLPAEITLPHRNYPLPTIFTLANSYQGRIIPFPGTTPVPSSSNSTVTSHTADLRPLPRPRPLFIEPENVKDKIPHVAKQDPTAFAFFLEGVSLLAWDIAWLCRSQGMYTGTESWEDVCNIGRNLWNLLIAPPPPPGLLRVPSGRELRRQRTGTANVNLSAPNRPFRLGHFSHDSARSFSEGGTDFLRGWKLTKYTMIVDPLKRALSGEISNAEWEMLEQDEWDDGSEQFRDDEAVFIKNRASTEIEGGSSFDDARSIMTARTERRSEDQGDQTHGRNESADAETAGGAMRVRGTSGWTKLKNREK